MGNDIPGRGLSRLANVWVDSTCSSVLESKSSDDGFFGLGGWWGGTKRPVKSAKAAYRESHSSNCSPLGSKVDVQGRKIKRPEAA